MGECGRFHYITFGEDAFGADASGQCLPVVFPDNDGYVGAMCDGASQFHIKVVLPVAKLYHAWGYDNPFACVHHFQYFQGHL